MKSALTEKAFELVKESEGELNSLKEKYNKLLEDFNFNLGLIKERDLELQEQDRKLEQYEKSCEEEADYEEIKFELMQASAELSELTKSYDELKQDYKAELQRLSDESEGYEDVELKLEKQEIKIEALVSENTRLKTEVADLRGENTKYENETAFAVKEATGCKLQFDSLNKELEKLEADNEVLHSKLGISEEKVAKLAQLNEEMLSDNRKLSDYVTELKELNKKEELKITDLNETLEKFLAKYKQNKASYKDLQLQYNRLENEAHKQLEEFQAKFTVFQNQQDAYEENLAQLTGQLSKEQGNKNQLKETLDTLEKEYLNQISQLKATANLQREDLTKQVNFYKSQNTQFAHQLEQQNQALKDLKKVQIENDRSTFKAQIQNMKADLSTFQDEIGRQRLQLELKERTVEQLREEIRLLKAQQAQNLEERKRCVDVQQQNASLQGQLREMQEEIASKQQQLNQLKTQQIISQCVGDAGKAAAGLGVQQENMISKLKCKLEEAAEQLKQLIGENEAQVEQIRELEARQTEYQQIINEQNKVIDELNSSFATLHREKGVEEKKSVQLQDTQEKTRAPVESLLDKSMLKSEIDKILADAGIE